MWFWPLEPAPSLGSHCQASKQNAYWESNKIYPKIVQNMRRTFLKNIHSVDKNYITYSDCEPSKKMSKVQVIEFQLYTLSKIPLSSFKSCLDSSIPKFPLFHNCTTFRCEKPTGICYLTVVLIQMCNSQILN